MTLRQLVELCCNYRRRNRCVFSAVDAGCKVLRGEKCEHFERAVLPLDKEGGAAREYSGKQLTCEKGGV